MRDPDAETTARDVFKEQFPGVRVDRIVALKHTDGDGDNVVKIYIVLNDEEAPLDRASLVGFVRHLRSHLADDAFPVLSYVAKNEADKLKLEPA
ncbi:MAG: hypothetical protein ACP5NI_06305 [Acetobacteraceae bacterium]